MVYTKRLFYLFCAMSLLVTLQGCASQSPGQVYKGLDFVSWNGLPILDYNEQRGEPKNWNLPSLLNYSVSITQQCSFQFEDSFGKGYLDATFKPNLTARGNEGSLEGKKGQMQFLYKPDKPQDLIERINVDCKRFFERVIEKQWRVRIESSHLDPLKDVLGAMQNFRSTKDSNYQKAYDEIKYIEVHVLPRMGRCAQLCEPRVRADASPIVEAIGRSLGLYKVLLELQMKQDGIDPLRKDSNRQQTPVVLSNSSLTTTEQEQTRPESTLRSSFFKNFFLPSISAALIILGFVAYYLKKIK